MRQLAWLAVLCLSGCIDTGQDGVEFPLLVAGTESGASFTTDDGWEVALDRADLAFGPLYLCAGVTAGDLCGTARVELVDSVVVDTLDSTASEAGMMQGLSGTVRSWMYDLGLVSLLTEQNPIETRAATELNGQSLRVEGVAERDDVTIAFSADLMIQQEEDTEQGVPVVRRSMNDEFERDIVGGESLTVTFDPRVWFATIDFSLLVSEEGCETDEFGTRCEVEVEPDTQAWRAIRNDVVAGVRPTFEWSTE